jgi:uncharacterized membrane protein YeiB
MEFHCFAPKPVRNPVPLPERPAAEPGPADPSIPLPAVGPGAGTAVAPRIAGYDVARALAVLSMILVNFRYLMEAEDNGPALLVRMTGWMDGRPAAAFAVLAGISLALMQRRRSTGDRPEHIRQLRIAVLKRALFLFLIGLTFLTIWPPDILHFYGIYFALGACFLTATDRSLWWFSALVLALATVLLIGFEILPGEGWVDVNDPAFWTPLGLLRNAFIDGYYPVLPWMGFILIGMWLGRRDLRDASQQRRLALASAVVFVLAETGARLIAYFTEMHTFVTDIPMIEYFFEAYPFPPTPVYFLSAGSTAVLAVVASLFIADRQSLRRWTAPLAAVGRMALSVYVLHILAGFLLLLATGRLDAENSLIFACVSAAAGCILAVLGCGIWLQHFRQGPLEALMRRFSKSTTTRKAGGLDFRP